MDEILLNFNGGNLSVGLLHCLRAPKNRQAFSHLSERLKGGLGLVLKIFKTTLDFLQSAFSLKIRQKQHWLGHSQRQENRILLTTV